MKKSRVRHWSIQNTKMNKRHCKACGGKLKFYGISERPIEPDDVFMLRWYKCTQCGAMEWRMGAKA